jgi:hypothetical protein
MKQLFKKTLVAATIAAACGQAVAGTVSVTKQTHSLEGLTGVTANQTSEAISYTIGAEYSVGDKITFTFTEGALVANSFSNNVSIAAVDNATQANARAGMTLGVLNSSANHVTYRVTQIVPADNTPGAGGTAWDTQTTVGVVFPVGTVKYTADSIRAGNVSVTVSAETTNDDILDNTGTLTAVLAEAKSQFGTVAMNTVFNGVINVSAARMAFVGGVTDSASFTITNPTTTGWLNTATITSTGVNLYGESGKWGTLKSSFFSSAGTRTFDADAARLGISYNGVITNDTITFTAPTGASAVVLEAQKFTTDMVYNYTSAANTAGSSTLTTGLSAGEWTLNGATVNIPYMPYSANASQIIYVTNTGTQSGNITGTAFDEAGKAYDLGDLGVSEKGTVKKLSAVVQQKLETAGFTAGKVSLTLTVNAPASDITVYASYNIGSADRGFINTDQYKGK